MNKTDNYSTIQYSVLVGLRILIGWHLLYEGISKLMMQGWSAAGFLRESQWIFSGIADWIVSNSGVLSVVNFMNTWGLLAIGTGLIVGMFARTAAYAGAFLLLIYYLNNAPMIGMEYSIPTEDNYLIVSKTLIEAVALMALAVFPSSKVFGFDYYIDKILKLKIK